MTFGYRMMKKIIVTLLVLLCSCEFTPAVKSAAAGNFTAVSAPDTFTGAAGADLPDSESLYNGLGLEGRASFEAFSRGVEGFYKTAGRRKDILTLIDFSKASTRERLWVIDMAAGKVLFSSHVAHGQGSGGNYATSFSNVSGSHKSSLGVYLTGATYNGGNGYSLLLDGLEKGVNDNARSRAIVVHGAAYADPSVIASTGRLGRSWGCPALPVAVTREIIDTIKEGSVLYIYGNNTTVTE